MFVRYGFCKYGWRFVRDAKDNRFNFYRKDSVKSLAHCQQACLDTNGCRSITWRPKNSWCQLESPNISLDPMDSSIGGTQWGYAYSGHTGVGEVVGIESYSNSFCYKKITEGNRGKITIYVTSLHASRYVCLKKFNDFHLFF